MSERLYWCEHWPCPFHGTEQDLAQHQAEKHPDEPKEGSDERTLIP